MRVTHEKRWRDLAQAVQRDVVRHFPDWTGGNAHDPGTALLELFAFLADNLLFRSRSLGAASDPGGAARHEQGLIRLSYFAGQLLAVDDFTDEQNYIREKSRRHNRRLHGSGIVTGLGVSIERRGGGARVVIAPGFALDPLGEEIDVPRRTSRPLSGKGKTLFVQVRYAERPCRPVPAPGSADPGEPPYSRVEETFEILIAPARDPKAVTIARLTRVRRGWVLDRRFEPPRVPPGSG